MNDKLRCCGGLTEVSPRAQSQRQNAQFLGYTQRQSNLRLIGIVRVHKRGAQQLNFPKRVLIADDDPIQRAVLDQIFATHGSEAVKAAADGLEAISAIEGSTEPFDLIVLDLHMPNCDGIELISYLESQNIKAAVLLISSLPDTVVRMSNTLAKVGGLRAIGSLRKPILLDDLLAIIAAQNWSRKRTPKFVRDDIAQSRHTG